MDARRSTISVLLQHVVVIVALISISPASAVVCSCYNGHPVSSTSCKCACNPGYLEPTCTFRVLDTVSVAFSLNMTADYFIAELFTNAVAYAASSEATFLWGKNVSTFLKTRVAVSLPGYAVSRLLDSVAFRDPWVEQYAIVSAHVLTPPASDSATSSDLSFDATLYETDTFVITVNSIIWFISGALLVVLLVGIETGLLHNDEHIVQPHSLKHRRSQSMRGGALADSGPTRQLSNLNEHRRKAPPPNMSLPEQILEDFVDSSDSGDEGRGRRSTTNTDGGKPRSSKYSLGTKSKSGGSQSLGAQSRSHSPHSPINNHRSARHPQHSDHHQSPKHGGHR